MFFEMFVVDRAPMDLQEAFSGEYQQQMNGADLLLLVNRPSRWLPDSQAASVFTSQLSRFRSLQRRLLT